MLLNVIKFFVNLAFALAPTFYHNVEIDNFVSDEKGVVYKYISYNSTLVSVPYLVFGTNVLRCEYVDKIKCFLGRKPQIYINIIKYQFYENAGENEYVPVPINSLITKAIDMGNYYYVCAIAESGDRIFLSEKKDYVGDNNPSFILLEIKQICR